MATVADVLSILYVRFRSVCVGFRSHGFRAFNSLCEIPGKSLAFTLQTENILSILYVRFGICELKSFIKRWLKLSILYVRFKVEAGGKMSDKVITFNSLCEIQCWDFSSQLL